MSKKREEEPTLLDLMCKHDAWVRAEQLRKPARSNAASRLGSRSYNSGKPLVSDAMSVLPKQAAKFNEDARRQGITGVYYRPDGLCEITSRKGRAMESARRGMYDGDAGYGDERKESWFTHEPE